MIKWIVKIFWWILLLQIRRTRRRLKSPHESFSNHQLRSWFSKYSDHLVSSQGYYYTGTGGLLLSQEMSVKEVSHVLSKIFQINLKTNLSQYQRKRAILTVGQTVSICLSNFLDVILCKSRSLEPIQFYSRLKNLQIWRYILTLETYRWLPNGLNKKKSSISNLDCLNYCRLFKIPSKYYIFYLVPV